MVGLDEWVTGKKSDVFDGLVRRFSHWRSPRRSWFSPWSSSRTQAMTRSLPEAIRVLKEMNADLKRKTP